MKSQTGPTTESLERTLEQTLAEVLAERGYPAAMAELRSWLDGGRSGSVGGTAFRIIFAASGPGERRGLIEAGLHNKHYFTVREAAIEAAMQLGDPSLHVLVAQRLYDPSDIVQRAARDAVLTMPLDEPALGDVLLGLVGGTDLRTLFLGPDEPRVVVPHLPVQVDDDARTQALKYPERARVYALECVWRPNRIGGLAEILLSLLDGDDGMLRVYAGLAIPFVGDPAVVEQQLTKRLQDTGRPPELQLAALMALGRMRRPSALPVFERYLADADLHLQRAAVVGIGRLPEHAGQDVLEDRWRALHAQH